MQDTQPIEDAEVVSDITSPNVSPNQPTTPPFDINAYNATLEIVRRRLGILEKSKAELKKLKEMHNDIFANNAAFL